MTEIVFEEPPLDGRRKANRDHAAVTRALRERPGEWARVFTCDTAASAGDTTWQINHGHLLPYRPKGAFEATARGKTVYARYVGGTDE